jgi:tellurite resistance protein TerC
MELLNTLWLGMPVWIWLAFIFVVLAILAFDLGVMHRDSHEIGVAESLKMSALYIGLGLAWAAAVYFIYASYGNAGALDPQIAAAATPDERAWTAVKLYMTGYLVEKTLAMDNVFIISMIFTYFAVPRQYQHRVLFWGILGVIVLRAIMIGLGAALVLQFTWIMYVFGVILLLTGVKMLVMMDQKPDIANNPVLKFLKKRLRVTNDMHGQNFTVRLPDPKTGKVMTYATPLLLCLILVEIADLVFAIDSVPAIFAITPDPFIVYTSNIFAILGLRALYFALDAVVHRFHYLKYALALVLIFIGTKIFLGDLVFDGKVPASISLGVTAGLLVAGVLYSLWKTRGGSTPSGGSPSGSGPSSGRGPAGSSAALKVADVRSPDFVSIRPGATVGEAATLMASARLNALLVVDDDGKPAGIVTDGDLIRREEFGGAPESTLWRTLFSDDRTLARAFAKAYGRHVHSVMSTELETTTDATLLADAAQRLFIRNIKALPVIEQGKVVGLLTRSDIVRALGRLGAEAQSAPVGDDAIREAIATRISGAGWVSPQQVSYAVAGGKVELDGTLTSQDQRAALLALAEGVCGVREVVDRLRVKPGLLAA